MKLPGIRKEIGIAQASAQASKGAAATGGSRVFQELAESIQAELAECYQVSSPAEIDAVADLSLALAKWMEIEAVRKVKIDQERSTATVRFDRLAADAFDRDKAAWSKDPESRTSIFARTYRGACHLSEIWARVLTELKAGEDIPFELACQALLAMGSHWQVHKADENAVTIMASFVKISADPALAAETWARESKMRDGLAFARRRVEKAVTRAPGVEDCRRGLLMVATQEAEGWKQVADKFRPEFEAARTAARDCAVGLGTGDPILEKELRNLNRLATTTRNHVEKLQRELEVLKKKRDTNGLADGRDSPSAAPAKSKAGRSGQSLKASSRDAEGKGPVASDSKKVGTKRGRGPIPLDQDTRQARVHEAPAKSRPEIHCGSQPDGYQHVASVSEGGGTGSGSPMAQDKITRSGTVRLTSSERKLLKMFRKVPDSPRRRNDIVRLFGSEQRFREMCAAMDAR